MAADVLTYNALNEVYKAKREELAVGIASIAVQNDLCQYAVNLKQTNCDDLRQASSVRHPELWGLIPTQPNNGSTFNNGLKVCNTDATFGCGCNCTWTVPAGASCARFQVWGAGAGSGAPCCCGVSPIGGSGAYASVVMPVTPGDTYILCAGCAYCCWAPHNGTNTANGCPSYVSGPGITSFIADGGIGNEFCMHKTRCVPAAIACDACYSPMWTYENLCDSGDNYCHYCPAASSCGSMGSEVKDSGTLPVIDSCAGFTATVAAGSTGYGIRGAHHFMQVQSEVAFCIRHSAVYPGGACCCHCCIHTSDRQGCCRTAGQGYMQIPGAGGWAGFACGGQNTNCADRGRMGMVCVSWLT